MIIRTAMVTGAGRGYGLELCARRARGDGRLGHRDPGRRHRRGGRRGDRRRARDA